MVDVRLIALRRVDDEPNISDEALLLPDKLAWPNKFREIMSRFSIDGRSRWPVLDGVVGQELAEVRNLKTP